MASSWALVCQNLILIIYLDSAWMKTWENMLSLPKVAGLHILKTVPTPPVAHGYTVVPMATRPKMASSRGLVCQNLILIIYLDSAWAKTWVNMLSLSEIESIFDF